MTAGFSDNGFTDNGFVSSITGISTPVSFKYNSTRSGTSFATDKIEESEQVVNVKLR